MIWIHEQNQSDDLDNSTSDESEENAYNFGFKSPRTPPQNNLFKAFEDELYAMIHELTFSRNRNDFQQKLHSDADKEYGIYGLLHDEVLFISDNIQCILFSVLAI